MSAVCTPFSLQSNSDRFDDCSRLLQEMKKKPLKILPARGRTTTRRRRRRGGGSSNATPSRRTRRRESLNAFDFRPQNLLEKMLFRVVVSRKKRQAPLVNYYISPKAKTNSSSGMTHFTSGQCHGKNGQKNLC